MLNLALVLKHILLTLTLTTCESSSFSINNGMKYIETQIPWSTLTWFNYFVCLTVAAKTGFLGKMGVLPVAAKIWDKGEGKALTQCRNGYFVFSCFPFEEQRKEENMKYEINMKLWNKTRFCNYRKKTWVCLRLFMGFFCFIVGLVFLK